MLGVTTPATPAALTAMPVAEYCDQRVCLSVCLSVCPQHLPNYTSERHHLLVRAGDSRGSVLSWRRCDHSCSWVGLTHGLGRAGLGWVEIFQFLVGRVGSTTAKVLKFERISLMHLKHG